MKKLMQYILVFMSVLLLTGCDIQSDSDQHQDRQVVLTVLAGQSTSDAGIEDMIDEWMEENFPDVRLEWECVNWGDRFATQMQSRIASGETPDIMIGKAQDVHNYAESGNLGEISEACVDKIADDAIASVTIDGKVYGVPYNAWYQGVIYNKNIFEEYQLTPPNTLGEMEEIVNVLEAHGITPFAGHYQESWKVANMTMQYMMNDVFCNDPEWGDEFRMGKRSFEDDENIRQCMMNQKYVKEHSFRDSVLIDQFESDSRFMNGEAAMYMTGSWSMQFADEYDGEVRFGIFPYPNQNGDSKLIRETNMTFMKGGNTAYSDLVDEIFLKLLEDEKIIREIITFTQSSSVIKNVEIEGDKALQEDIDYYESQGQIIDVTIGNSQLVWDFQNAFAEQVLLWLKGEKKLDDVLKYADNNRSYSVFMEE